MDDLGNTKLTLRRYKKIPLYIVEYHHEIIPFVQRAIGSRHLPLEGIHFVHFDSHPDMLIPKDMPAEHAYDRQKLLESISIENWMLPAAYVGHFKNLSWIKPVWAGQIEDGHHSFVIGRERNGGCIRVNSPLHYFISECLVSKSENLENVREISLAVFTLGKEILNENDDFDRIHHEMNTYLKEDVFILDIDLDFFSTSNPFKALYGDANMYEELKKIYNFNYPKSKDIDQILSVLPEREKQIEELGSLFKHLQEFRKLPDAENPTDNYVKVQILQEKLLKHYSDEEIDYEIVHDAGCTYDDTELPHHVSTEEEIDILLDSFKKFLDILSHAPILITISRSTEDDYTPQEDVEMIQEKVIKCLHDKYDCEEPVLSYLDDKAVEDNT